MTAHDVRTPDGLSQFGVAFQENGAALFRGVVERGELVDLGGRFGAVLRHRDSDRDGVTTLAVDSDDVLDQPPGFAGFGRGALSPHTDRSSSAVPPDLLLVACTSSAAAGGESLLVDGRCVYRDLAEHHPSALADLSAPRTVLFGGATGRLAAVFTCTAGRVSIRLRLDDLVSFSPVVERHLPLLRAVIARHTHAVPLAPGEGYLLDNNRWLHGRRAFTGHRAVYRVHGVVPGLHARGFPMPAARSVA